MEIWKDIKEYKGLYQVSNLGKVRSLYSGKFKLLKLQKGPNGYLRVNLFLDKKQHCELVHRLVYSTFKNVKSNRQYVVDHIDNDIFNNILDNLQLVTNRYNSSKDKKSLTNHYNIYKNGPSYLIRMRINYIKFSIGSFKNLEKAISIRDEFINNWLCKINKENSFFEIKEIIELYRNKLK